jgi:hypothetical protein
MWNDKLPDGRDPRPIYWIVTGLFSLLLGIGWLTLVAADRMPSSTRGLEFLFVLLGIGATIYGVVLVFRSRRKR